MAETTFSEWLVGALAGRPNVFLVKNSGTKDNGRPVIDDSRVSKWRKGEQRPSPEMAQLAARILGRPEAEGLEAAGYNFTLSVTVNEEGVQRTDVGGDFREWIETTDVLTNFQKEQVLRMMDEKLPVRVQVPVLPDPRDLPDGDLKERYMRAVETGDPIIQEFLDAKVAKARKESEVDGTLAPAANKGDIEPDEFND